MLIFRIAVFRQFLQNNEIKNCRKLGRGGCSHSKVEDSSCLMQLRLNLQLLNYQRAIREAEKALYILETSDAAIDGSAVKIKIYSLLRNIF